MRTLAGIGSNGMQPSVPRGAVHYRAWSLVAALGWLLVQLASTSTRVSASTDAGSGAPVTPGAVNEIRTADYAIRLNKDHDLVIELPNSLVAADQFNRDLKRGVDELQRYQHPRFLVAITGPTNPDQPQTRYPLDWCGYALDALDEHRAKVSGLSIENIAGAQSSSGTNFWGQLRGGETYHFVVHYLRLLNTDSRVLELLINRLRVGERTEVQLHGLTELALDQIQPRYFWSVQVFKCSHLGTLRLPRYGVDGVGHWPVSYGQPRPLQLCRNLSAQIVTLLAVEHLVVIAAPGQRLTTLTDTIFDITGNLIHAHDPVTQTQGVIYNTQRVSIKAKYLMLRVTAEHKYAYRGGVQDISAEIRSFISWAVLVCSQAEMLTVRVEPDADTLCLDIYSSWVNPYGLTLPTNQSEAIYHIFVQKIEPNIPEDEEEIISIIKLGANDSVTDPEVAEFTACIFIPEQLIRNLTHKVSFVSLTKQYAPTLPFMVMLKKFLHPTEFPREECVYCLETLCPAEAAEVPSPEDTPNDLVIFPCGHCFHYNCFQDAINAAPYLATFINCPLCRAEIVCRPLELASLRQTERGTFTLVDSEDNTWEINNRDLCFWNINSPAHQVTANEQ